MNRFISTFSVAALGYFVDIYDLILFGVVRVESLKAIGVPADRILDVGMWLINCQMAGMLLGGLFWGVLGDKRGRSTVMMASILLYSLANLANAFVFSEMSYGVLRFIAGFGLAGEVGAAVTLISESMSAQRRTLGTTLLTTFGLMGAIAASLVGDYLHWKMAYWVGGGMGLVLLLLRLRIAESHVYENSITKQRGQLKLFFQSRERLLRYFACVFVAVPVWFVVGILMTFSPEIMLAMGDTTSVSASRAIMLCYIGICVGDLLCGLISHTIQSRRQVMGFFLLLNATLMTVYLHYGAANSVVFDLLCAALGFSAGYWGVFITMVTESFGTNIRATAVITITNWMRGSMIPLIFSIQTLKNYFSLPQSAFIVATVVLILASISLLYLSESFAKDLNYHEA